MDVLIVEDDQEQLDGIESILLEKYDHMNCIKATNYQQAAQLEKPIIQGPMSWVTNAEFGARKQNPTILIGYFSWR